MTDFAELDALTTEELRERAFAKARHHRDLGFFWRLFEHVPSVEAPDDALGLESGVDEAVAVWRETTGHEYGDQEPLIRAAFIDYLRKS